MNVINRPRGGNFLYSTIEFGVMERAILACKKLGVDGVVIGLLTANSDIDVNRTRNLVELAAHMPVTFHRAFESMRFLKDALAMNE